MSKQMIKKEAVGETGESEAVAGIASGAAGNVGQIRDILFGGQMREYDRRFARIESRLDQEMVALREDLRKQMELLGSYVKKEFSTISEQIFSEQQKRERSTDTLNDQIKQAANEFKEKLGHFESDTDKNLREIRHALLDSAKTLMEDVERKIGVAVATMTQAQKELRAEKMDRTTLSNLLNEIAIRIADEEGFSGLLSPGEAEND